MMSPHDNMKPPAGKDETNLSSGRKTPASASSRPPQDPPPKCPRCDSPNTKFCYYNNYSLTQPRHFCKTCRRYWTNGGALRNVPIGGGCRKSKKIKPSPRTSDDSNNSDVGGLKFFQGLSPAMDFQLNFPRNTGLLNQFSSLDNLPNPACFGLDNPSAASSSSPMGFGFQELGSLNCHQGSNLTSSIESLSSINQDLHWKLQKQRLGLLFVGDHNNNQKQNYNNNHSNNIIPSFETLVQNQKPQPILFQNLDLSCAADIAKDDAGGGGDACGNHNTTATSLSTEWFFDNSYATTMNPTPATSGNNLNGDTNVNWNGVHDLY